MIRTRNIYEPPSPDDGYRLLVMRRWPRGVPKERVDGWQKELGPSLALLDDYRKGKLDWPSFAQRYDQEMKAKPELLRKVAHVAQKRDVTLLCSCREEQRCHRTLLKKLVEALGLTSAG